MVTIEVFCTECDYCDTVGEKRYDGWIEYNRGVCPECGSKTEIDVFDKRRSKRKKVKEEEVV